VNHKHLCPDCWYEFRFVCNAAYARDLVRTPRFPEARHLFETDRYSRGLA